MEIKTAKKEERGREGCEGRQRVTEGRRKGARGGGREGEREEGWKGRNEAGSREERRKAFASCAADVSHVAQHFQNFIRFLLKMELTSIFSAGLGQAHVPSPCIAAVGLSSTVEL